MEGSAMQMKDSGLSREVIQEFLDAHKEGGEKAILALLKKAAREGRRAEAAKRQDKNDPNNIFHLT